MTRVRATGALLLVEPHICALVAWITLRPLDVPWVSPPTSARSPAYEPISRWARRKPSPGRIGHGLGLLAPLGVLLPMAGGRLTASPLGSLVRTVAAGALISLGIELLQTGVPGQVVDVDSLLLNTVGVALAHLAIVPAARVRFATRAEARHGAALPGGRGSR